MTTLSIWHGTEAEALALNTAISPNCMCEFDTKTSVRTRTCAPHEALLHDQRFLDGLLFMRRKQACLVREEFST